MQPTIANICDYCDIICTDCTIAQNKTACTSYKCLNLFNYYGTCLTTLIILLII